MIYSHRFSLCSVFIVILILPQYATVAPIPDDLLLPHRFKVSSVVVEILVTES